MALASITFIPAARAHPIHRSIAEANYDAGTQTLEVALRVFADDFEAALSARAKKKISLEKTPAAELDSLARAYLSEIFAVTARDGTRPTPRWLGRDLKDAENELWFFFELLLPGGIEGTKIKYAVLSDQFPDQLNSVFVRAGSRKVTLVFLATDTEKTVKLAP